VHTAIFDAWAAYDGRALGTQLGSNLRRPISERTNANKSAAISFAAYQSLVDLFPTQKSKFDEHMRELGYDPSFVGVDPGTAAGVGNIAAQALLSARHRDGSNQLGDLHLGAYSDYTGYVPTNSPDSVRDPNAWQPLRVPTTQGSFSIQQYVAPHWGLVRPFALASASEFRPRRGPARTDEDAGLYRKQALAILHLNAKLTDEEKVIAEFWADGPSSEQPPGHWCLIAQFVSKRDGLSLDEDVKLFFAVSNAVFDAGIAAWDAKRAYNSVRPITAIRLLLAGKPIRAWGGPYLGTIDMSGDQWTPYQAATFPTPPFPEFVSGHSTFSAAAAEVLRSFTGSDLYGGQFVARAGSSKFEPGAVPATDITLTWATFSAAADQAGLSRRYGGIHFEDGDLAGRRLGRLVGAKVWAKVQTYINATE
jgi:hypothetical protein